MLTVIVYASCKDASMDRVFSCVCYFVCLFSKRMA